MYSLEPCDTRTSWQSFLTLQRKCKQNLLSICIVVIRDVWPLDLVIQTLHGCAGKGVTLDDIWTTARWWVNQGTDVKKLLHHRNILALDRDKGSLVPSLDKNAIKIVLVLCPILPMTHVPKISAENPYQKIGIINRHENRGCPIHYLKLVPEKFSTKLHVRCARNQYRFFW